MRFTLFISLCIISLAIAILLYIWEARKLSPKSDGVIKELKRSSPDTSFSSNTLIEVSQSKPIYYSAQNNIGSLNVDSIFQANGLVDVQQLDSSLKVSLKYATEDNFMGKNVYGDLCKAYLRPEVAKMLAKAQKDLKMKHPDLNIIIYDAARPQSVQFIMWNIVVGTEEQHYVAPPIPGSLHNYGCSVDVSLVDSLGQPLDMGTEYDSFDLKSQPRHEKKFLKSGELTREQVANRKILRNAMQAGGFLYMLKEWWHFDAYPPEKVMKNYKIIK